MTTISRSGRRAPVNRSLQNPRQQRGYVLVTVIVFAFLTAAIAYLLGNETSINTSIATGELEREELRYVTEAGKQHAQWLADRSTCNSYGLPDTPFGDHRYSALFSPPGGSPVTITTIGTLDTGASRTHSANGTRIFEPPTKFVVQPDADALADTYLDRANSNMNFGINNLLMVEGDDTAKHSLLRFDLGHVPDDAKLVSAILELNSRSIDDSGEVNIHQMKNGWLEGLQSTGIGSGASWNERDGGEPWAAAGGDYDSAIAATSVIKEPNNQWHQWDVSSLVEGWISGAVINNGLILVPANDSVKVAFESSDSGSKNEHPRLILTYACECGTGGKATSLVLQPGSVDGKDTRILGIPDVNFGSDSLLQVSVTAGASANSLLEFDVSSIQKGVTITSATLDLDALTVDTPGSVGVHGVNTAWQELQATWTKARSTVPWMTPGGDYSTPAADSQIVSSPGTVSFDVTSIVSSWVQAGANNNGILLRPSSGMVNAAFTSSDSSNVGGRPRLTVNYSCPCGVDCIEGGGEATYCDADFEAVSKALSYKWEPTYKELSGIDYLREGTVINGITIPVGGGWVMADRGEDKLFVSDALGTPLTDFVIDPSDAYGIALVEGGPWAGHLGVVDKGDDAVYFLDLDGVNLASISTALYTSDPFGLSYIGATASNVYDDHLAITSNKNDGDIYIVDQTGILKKSIDVQSFASDPQGVAHLTGFDKLMVIDKTGLISIIDFNGALLHQYETATWGFSATQGITINPATCDHVVIDKTALRVGGFNIEGVQGGVPKLLMVVANDNNLSSQEAAKKTLFELWRYLVTVIDDGAALASFDTAVAANDVAFVGEDIAASKLDDKLADAPIGVVYEEVNLSDEFGLASSVGWSGGTNLDIDDNSHYIAHPFSIGPLAIASATIDLANVAGTLAPDLRQLASESAGPMLVTLEAEAKTFDSMQASGRRAQLPWGGSNFQIADLTDDGETILRRALEWGIQPPPRCDADFAANNLKSEFAWSPDAADIQGIDYLPANLVVNSVSIPAGGGWIMNDKSKDKLFVTDIDGNSLTDVPMVVFDSQGVALIDAGQWIHYIAVADKSKKRIYYLDLDGDIEWSFSTPPITSGDPLGLTFIGATASGDYDHHLAFSSEKNASGGGTATVYILDQGGALKKTIDVEAFAPKPMGVTHLAGADKLLVTDEAGRVSVIDFNGNLLHQYFADHFGRLKSSDIGINPYNCNHVIVDKDLKSVASFDRVSDSGIDPRYYVMYLPWNASVADAWGTKNLGIYGIPGNAVAEIAVVNTDGGKEWWGGVRAAGSTFDRRLKIHEADGGGMDVMTMHVQTDSVGRIEHYAEVTDKLTFILLGYWTNVAYVENWQTFKAGAAGSWNTIKLSAFGVGANEVAEILMVNKSAINERRAGVRTEGASLSRIVNLHEAKDGGNEMMSMSVTAESGADAKIEVFAEDNNNIDFYLLGHWSTPPGTFTSVFEDLGTATVKDLWEVKDLGPYGVPADAVAQIAPVNAEDGAEALLGLRPTGSLQARLLEPHQSKNGGEELAVMHVTVDASREIQWYDKDTSKIHRFYLLGWWE